MSYLCNARVGGTGPLPGRRLKLGPGRGSPWTQRSAQARPAPPAQAGQGPRVIGPGRSRTGPTCRAVGWAVVPRATWLLSQPLGPRQIFFDPAFRQRFFLFFAEGRSLGSRQRNFLFFRFSSPFFMGIKYIVFNTILKIGSNLTFFYIFC